MAESDIVKGTDLIEKGYLKDAKKEAQDLVTVIDTLTLSFSELVKIQKNGLANIKKIGGATDAKSLKATQQALDEVTEARKKAVEVDKIRLEYTKKFEAQRKQELADFQKKQKAEEKALKDAEKAAKQREKDIKQLTEQNRAYNVASKRLNELRKDYKDLAIAGQGGTQAAKDMLKEIQKLDTELKEVDASVGQFNREVGNYKNQVKDAINESDLFTKSLGGMSESSQIIIQGFSRLQKGLVSVKNQLKETEGATKKIGLTLKAAGIGLLITALASLGAFFKGSREGGQEFALIIARISATINVLVGNLSKAGKGILGLGTAIKQFFSGDFSDASKTATESIDNIKNAFDGTADRINKVVDATVELTKETYAYENALRQLQLSLLKSNLDEEDFNEIAGDATRTLKEQKAALEDAAKARLVSAQISAKIAQKEEELAFKGTLAKLQSMQVSEAELALIKKQGAERLVTGKFAEKLDQQELDALNEKVKANINAQDALADLPRQEAQRRRDQIQKETEFQIELTRSKKLAASSELAILTKQVADEKIQLEERRKIREELNRAEIATQQNQFELFNKGIEEENKINAKGAAELKQRVDFRSLVAEKDEVILAERIRALKLSEGQQIIVAKVVKEAQLQEIANNELIAKQDEEELARKEKIAQIDREILAIQKQTEIESVASVKDERANDLKEQNSVILQNENVFNRKLIEERKATFEATKELTDEEFKLKEAQLKALAGNEIINLKTNDLQVRAEEELKIKEKLNADLIKLERDRSKITTDLAEKEIEMQRAINIEKTEIVLKQLNDVTEAIGEALDARNQREAKEADRAIAKREQTIEIQQRLAERGLKNTLAEEKAALNKQEVERREAEEKAVRQQQALALVQQFNGFLQAALKETPTPTGSQAIMSATRNTFLAKGIAEGFTRVFEDGGVLEGPSHKEGGIRGTGRFSNIEVEGGEYIVNKKATKKNKALLDMVNANVDLSSIVAIPDLGKIEDQKGSTAYNVAQSLILQQNNELGKMKGILEQIASKPALSADHLGNIIETSYKNKVKHETTHILNSKTRI